MASSASTPANITESISACSFASRSRANAACESSALCSAAASTPRAGSVAAAVASSAARCWSAPRCARSWATRSARSRCSVANTVLTCDARSARRQKGSVRGGRAQPRGPAPRIRCPPPPPAPPPSPALGCVRRSRSLSQVPSTPPGPRPPAELSTPGADWFTSADVEPTRFRPTVGGRAGSSPPRALARLTLLDGATGGSGCCGAGTTGSPCASTPVHSGFGALCL